MQMRVPAAVLCGIGAFYPVWFAILYLGWVGNGTWLVSFGSILLLAGVLWLRSAAYAAGEEAAYAALLAKRAAALATKNA